MGLNEDSGWQKIIRVHGQAFRDQRGRIEDAVVWIVTDRDEVFAVSIPRGHNVKSVVQHYKKRGWTDERAIYFGPLPSKKKYVRRKNRDPGSRITSVMKRKTPHHSRDKTEYGRDKTSARRRAKGRPLNPYSRFVKSHKGSGLTFSEIAKLWRKKKRSLSASTTTRLKRHVTKHTRKGTKMTTRALPKELLDLARALREASAKEPSAAKASAIERKMESLIRQLRKAQKSAGSKARSERENEEIRAQAREWASKGPSGDPKRRKKSAYAKFLKAHKGKGHSLKSLRAKWKRLGVAGKAKYGHVKKTTRRKSHRDPGYSHARAHRARRHSARRHRGHRDPY
jgi:hypothetical protein